MPGPELLLAFLAATAVFAYMPGPAMLYTAAQTLSRGPRAGAMAALGIHVGGYFHVIASAAGLSALLAAVPALYTVVKFLGAGYLMFLGAQLIWQARRPAGRAATDVEPRPAKSKRRAFLDSIVVEVLNPKAALFFLAFLPQFVDPAAAWPVWVQFLILGTVVNVMFSSADVVCVALAGEVMKRMKRSTNAQRLMQMGGGAILVGLGIKLALHRQ